jgi:hypothetical protein
VYDPVPPVAVTEALPLHEPKQVTLVCVGVNVIAGGCVMVYVWVAVHPAGEETVTV